METSAGPMKKVPAPPIVGMPLSVPLTRDTSQMLMSSAPRLARYSGNRPTMSSMTSGGASVAPLASVENARLTSVAPLPKSTMSIPQDHDSLYAILPFSSALGRTA